MRLDGVRARNDSIREEGDAPDRLPMSPNDQTNKNVRLRPSALLAL